MQHAGFPVIGLIGLHVFRQVVRERALHVAGLFALLLIAAHWLIGQVAAGQEVRVLKDLGLAAATVAGLLIAVLVGTGLVAGEVERGTMYMTLSRPVRRQELILGQFAGLALALAVAVGVMAAALYGLLAWTAMTASDALRRGWEAPAADPALLRAYFLIFMELLVVAAIALLFSTFASRVLAAAMTAGMYVVGHFNADLRAIGEVTGPGAAAFVATCLSYVLPDLGPLNVSARVVHGEPVTAAYLALTGGYALAYAAALLVAAAFIFSRRDLP